MKTTYTYNDLADDVKKRVELTEKAAEDMSDAIARLLTAGRVLDEERIELYTAMSIARRVADREAAIALSSLRTLTRRQ